MKVVVIAGVAGSLVNFRGHLLSALRASGCEVVGCAPEGEDAAIRQLHKLDVRFVRCTIRRTGMNPLSDLRTFLSLRRILRAEQPDVVFNYTIKPVIYGSLAAAAASVPRIFSMITGAGYAFLRENWKQKAVASLVKPLYRRALRHNGAVFFQNPDDLELFAALRLLRSREQAVLVNGSGVDLEYFRPAPLPEGPPVFLLIARFYREKGIREFVEAARLLRPRHPQAAFRLLGSIDSNPTAISTGELEAWKAERIIQHTPWVDDVRPYIEASCVYVLPSYREGTPRTVLEAMAMARPIITTDAPGCRETVVDSENGILVPVKNAEALAAAMERFILHPELIESMGARSRLLAEQKYDVHKVNQVMLEAMGLLQSSDRLQNSAPPLRSVTDANLAREVSL